MKRPTRERNASTARRTPAARRLAERRGAFCNVDLDVEARTDLSPLVAALDRKLLILHSEVSTRRSFIRAELNWARGSAERRIIGFARIIGDLRGPARSLWRQCTVRALNAGYTAGTEFPPFVDRLSPDALRAAIRIGASIVVTIYPPEAQEQDRPPRSPSRARSRSG